MVDVGLPGDEIMQKFLSRRIYHEFELRVVENDGHSHIGFITGFDDRCLQLSTSPINESDEPRAVIIYWPFIRRIEETGSRIDCLVPEHRKKIRSYTHALRDVCEKAITNGSRSGGSAGDLVRLPVG